MTIRLRSALRGRFLIAALASTAAVTASADAADPSNKKSKAAPVGYDEGAARALDAAGLAFEYQEGDFKFEPCSAQAVIFFDLDSAVVTEAARAELAKSLSAIDRNCANLAISIEAATDTSGNAARNQALSERRAEAARQEVLKLGFQSAKVSVSAVGESELLVSTADGTRQPLNRRANIEATGEKRPAGFALAAPAPASDSDERAPTEIIPKEEMPNFGLGAKDDAYDVILQPGHYLRTANRTGATGAQTTERAMASQIVARMARRLIDDGHSVLVIPADDYRRPMKAKVFLTVHFDGSDAACTTDSSLGYGDDALRFASHAFGHAIAVSLGKSPAEFMRDNFTENLSKYYAFKHMDASQFEGIVEVGELTCPAEEQLIIDRAHLIARNLARTVDYLVGIEPGS